MTPSDVEAVYEHLAQALDRVGPDRRELFLAKLALLLSRDLADATLVCGRIDEAALNLDA